MAECKEFSGLAAWPPADSFVMGAKWAWEKLYEEYKMSLTDELAKIAMAEKKAKEEAAMKAAEEHRKALFPKRAATPGYEPVAGGEAKLRYEPVPRHVECPVCGDWRAFGELSVHMRAAHPEARLAAEPVPLASEALASETVADGAPPQCASGRFYDGKGNVAQGPGISDPAANGWDPVEKPLHYNSHPSKLECIQVTEHMNFCLGNAVKYVWRADLKGGVLDLKKAVWYLEREIERRLKLATK